MTLNWHELKITIPNQIKLFQNPDTHGISDFHDFLRKSKQGDNILQEVKTL